MENSETVSRISGPGRLQEVVVYEKFQCKSLTENMGGSRFWEVVARGGSTVRSKGTDGFKTFLLGCLPL